MSSPLSGFTAVPNPQMLSFMPIQSYLMMYFAGAGWQIGKRKISAIPNDKFNKMSANDLLKGFTADLRETIPTLERSLQDVTPLVRILIEQYGEFMKEILKVTPVVSKDILFGDQGIFSPTEVGNKALIDDIMKFLRNQFPSLPKAFPTSTKNVPEPLPTPKVSQPTRPFIGPEINPITGETTPFVAARKSLPAPSPHIVSRTSNVSIQSLQLEEKHLESIIRELTVKLQQEQNRTGQAISTKRARVSAVFNQLQTAKQKLADFLKMHGSRL